MEFLHACEALNRWVSRSKGELIPMTDGMLFSFSVTQRLSRQAVERWESESGISLPEDYREFLERVGAGAYFVRRHGTGVLMHRLDDIEAYTAEVFLGRRNPFPSLLLVASLTGRGDEAGFDLKRDGTNFGVFSGEDDPERWLSETRSWTTFGSWLARLVESEGEDDLPR